MGRGDDSVPSAGDAALGDEDGARVGGGDARIAIEGVAMDVAGELVEDEDERDGGFGGGVRPRVQRAGLGGGERGGEASGHSLVRRALRGAILVPRGKPLALVILLRMRGKGSRGGETDGPRRQGRCRRRETRRWAAPEEDARRRGRARVSARSRRWRTSRSPPNQNSRTSSTLASAPSLAIVPRRTASGAE